MAAQYWEPDHARYVTVHEIPLDGAVRIYARKTRTITLRAAPATPAISPGYMEHLPASPPHVPVRSVIELYYATNLNQPTTASGPRHVILERSTKRLTGPPVVDRWPRRATKSGKTLLYMDSRMGWTTPYLIVIDPAS